MRAFVILVLVSLICASSLHADKCGMKELDTKLSLLTNVVREVHLPTNHQEADQYCRAYKKNLDQAQKFNDKCSEGEMRTILTLSLKAMEKLTIKQYCKIKAIREKSIETSNCFNSGKDTAAKYWPQTISSITLASNWSDSSARIPLLCCSLIKWRENFLKTYEGIGGPVCTEANIEHIDKYTHQAMLDPMRVFCSEFQFTDKCDKYEKIIESMQMTKVDYLTPFPAILQLFKNLYSSPTLDQNMINSSMSYKSDVILILIASCINLLYFIGIN